MVLTMCRLLAIWWSVEQYFKKHTRDYDQPLEIPHRGALSQIKSVLEWPMGVTLKVESKKVVTAGSTLEVFTKLLDWLRGIGRGQEEDMNQGLLWYLLMGRTANSRKNYKMMERFSSAKFSWPI